MPHEPCLTPDLRPEPRLFNDRELSFLRFQQRVFEEASDRTTPLLDRAKLLAIVGTQLDDFIMVRASELRRNMARCLAVESMATRLLYDVEVYWRRRLLPALRAAGIRFIDYNRLSQEDRPALSRHFAERVYPLLSPRSCDRAEPFPHVPTLGMNLMVAAADAGQERLFILRVPDTLSPLVPLDARRQAAHDVAFEEAVSTYVWLDQLVTANLPALFPQLRVVAAYRFRLLREMDVPPHMLASNGAVARVLEMLDHRASNPVALLVVERRMPARLIDVLAGGLGVPDTLVRRAGIVSDLRRLWDVSRIARPDLKAPPIVRTKPASLRQQADVLEAARRGDILFHHPYDSFEPIVEMMQQAAEDPAVVSISATLYRTDRESPVAHALLDAARRGRQVRVLVELNARLDERRNVNWSRLFEQAGAVVVHAPDGLKVHAKMALIVRREGSGMRRYAHLSSGNYNAFTARTYTDLALLTCDEDITADVAALFDALCGGTGLGELRALTVAPLTMRRFLTGLIEREIASHRRGGQGHIILKTNGLVDRDVIRQLSHASQAGVTVDLLVRSQCCLRPGIPGTSDCIRVRSIVGRFLEHSRAWYFRNGGCEDVYIGSADLMPRNFDRRVEVMAPLKDAGLRRRVIAILRTYLADNVKARELRADGTYVRHVARPGEPIVEAQLALLKEPAGARSERPLDPSVGSLRGGGMMPAEVACAPAVGLE